MGQDEWDCIAERLHEVDWKQKNCWDNIPAESIREWHNANSDCFAYLFRDGSIIADDGTGHAWYHDLDEMIQDTGMTNDDGAFVGWDEVPIGETI